MTTTEAVRDRAYQILADRGHKPLDVDQPTWSAACDEARAELDDGDDPNVDADHIWRNR